MPTPPIHLKAHTFHGINIDVVDAHDLYAFFQLRQNFYSWITNKIEHYGFEKEVDYFVKKNPDASDKTAKTSYFLTLDMAKELATMEKSDKGRYTRRYLIECEKKLASQKLKSDAASLADLEAEKYQKLNGIIASMDFQNDPVVIPAMEVVDMVRAIRMYQQQIAQLKTPEWVNDNLDRIKQYTSRNFTDS